MHSLSGNDTLCQPFLLCFQQNLGISDNAAWLGKTVTELPIFTLGLNKRPGLIVSFCDAIWKFCTLAGECVREALSSRWPTDCQCPLPSERTYLNKVPFSVTSDSWSSLRRWPLHSKTTPGNFVCGPGANNTLTFFIYLFIYSLTFVMRRQGQLTLGMHDRGLHH